MTPTLDIINKQNVTTYTRKDITDYSLKTIGIDKPKEFFSKHYKLFDEAKPVDGALYYLQKLHSEGHKMHLISARDYRDDALERTIDWFYRNKVKYDSIVCFAKRQKGTIAKSRNLDFYVDDCIDEVLDVKKAGIKNSVVFNAPWNEQYTFRFMDIGRLYTWTNIYDYIGALK